MSQEQLDRAYELIQAERTDEAITILEPLIRADPDNADAWWLYANATTGPEARRNALNNVLRIGTHPEREEQARLMQKALQEPPEFSALPTGTPTALYQPPTSRVPRLAKLGLGFIAGMSLCACVACFWLVNIAGRMATLPTDFDAQGMISSGDSASGFIDTEGDWDGYLYDGRAGERIELVVRPVEQAAPPFIFLYAPDDTALAVTSDTSVTANRLQVVLPQDGIYVILVRPFMGFGAGEYDLTVASDAPGEDE